MNNVALSDCPVAVRALDLDRGADLAVELGVTVNILNEMAIDAVHPLLKVNVELVHGQAVTLGFGAIECSLLRGRRVPGSIALFQLRRQADRLHQGRGGAIPDGLPAVVQQVSLSILLEHGAKDPTMAVIVGELGVACPRIQIGDFFQKGRVGPVPPRRGLVGVRHHRASELFRRRVLLVLGIHQLPVGLLVPPHVTGICVEHRCAGMNVADNALAGGDPGDKLVLDRVAPLSLRNGRVWLET